MLNKVGVPPFYQECHRSQAGQLWFARPSGLREREREREKEREVNQMTQARMLQLLLS
jgi:hypothetical protein